MNGTRIRASSPSTNAVPEVTGLSVTVGVVVKAAGHAQRCVDLSRMDGLSCMQRLPLDDLSRTAHAVTRADTATERVPVALLTERYPQRERECGRTYSETRHQ